MQKWGSINFYNFKLIFTIFMATFLGRNNVDVYTFVMFSVKMLTIIYGLQPSWFHHFHI